MNPKLNVIIAIEKEFRQHMQRCQLKLYNGGQECDVLFEGPCSCGAWHFREEFMDRCNRGGANLWPQIVADCIANKITIPASFVQYDAILGKKEW